MPASPPDQVETPRRGRFWPRGAKQVAASTKPAAPRELLHRIVAGPPAERSSSDLLLVAGGIALGLTCAFFPWYVFFNQEQFGIRAVKFGGNPGTGTQPANAMPVGHIAAPLVAPETAAETLDTFSTGTLADPDKPVATPGLADQPFPSQDPSFTLVHVANGRAMIEDDKGLWVVQPGSKLPDDSRVTSIEKRNGTWVLVTSGDRVLEIAR